MDLCHSASKLGAGCPGVKAIRAQMNARFAQFSWTLHTPEPDRHIKPVRPCLRSPSFWPLSACAPRPNASSSAPSLDGGQRAQEQGGSRQAASGDGPSGATQARSWLRRCSSIPMGSGATAHARAGFHQSSSWCWRVCADVRALQNSATPRRFPEQEPSRHTGRRRRLPPRWGL